MSTSTSSSSRSSSRSSAIDSSQASLSDITNSEDHNQNFAIVSQNEIEKDRKSKEIIDEIAKDVRESVVSSKVREPLILFAPGERIQVKEGGIGLIPHMSNPILRGPI